MTSVGREKKKGLRERRQYVSKAICEQHEHLVKQLSVVNKYQKIKS